MIVDADVGKRLSVQVIGWNTETATLGATSETTSPVAAAPRFTTAATPTMAGSARVGATLTLSTGEWQPDPDYISAQWLRDGTPIDGATEAGYTLASADLGAVMSVRVTGSKAGYASASRTSAATGKVAAGVLSGVKPKVSGKPKVGRTLTANPGTWGPAGVVLTFKWYRGSKAIKGATTDTYRLTRADKGKRLKVKVTGRLDGYTTLTKTSARTARVKK